MKRHKLTEQQWNRIKKHLPLEKNPKEERSGKNNRLMLNVILYCLNTGAPWRNLPERFRPYSRFRVWTLRGVWDNVLTDLIAEDLVDETTLMLDSTTVKVYQHASAPKKGKKPGEAEKDLPQKSMR